MSLTLKSPAMAARRAALIIAMCASGVAHAAAQPSASELAAPPVNFDRQRTLLCQCAKAPPPDAVIEGLVVDAELTLGPNRRSVLDRRATVFDVFSARSDGKALPMADTARIYHSGDLVRCGVAFDYGRRYAVPVRKTESGEFETDFCLVKAAETPLRAPEGERDE